MTEGDRLGDVFAQGSPEVRVISSGSELCENTYSEFQVYSSGVDTDRFRFCVCVKQGHKSAVALACSKLGALTIPALMHARLIHSGGFLDLSDFSNV